jgi:hypothetical protein
MSPATSVGPAVYGPNPTLFWLIFALFVIGAAIQEENNLKTELEDEYRLWRRNTPFFIPIPSRIANGIQLLIKRLIKKDWPSNNKEILTVLTFFGILTIVSSIVFMIAVQFFSEFANFITSFIDWIP